MFKDFTGFNALASKLFNDEQFNLVATAFRSFQNLLTALRTEAFDYTTWYNKVMRDKYEDGEPVDVTALPYLSVPRSQLAVMRARIAKVRSMVEYAANALTNVALGYKVSSPVHSTITADDITRQVSGTTSIPILNALKRIVYCIGNVMITFVEGTDTVTVNGVSIGLSPLARGTMHMVKWLTGNDARVGFIDYNHDILAHVGTPMIRSVAGELIRSYCRTPLVVARSAADLASSSNAPIGVVLANRGFFGKRLVVWMESGNTINNIYGDGAVRGTVHECTLHCFIDDSANVKSRIASDLYEYLSEDYNEAMSYAAPTEAKLIFSAWSGDDTQAMVQVYTDQTLSSYNNAAIVFSLTPQSATDTPVYSDDSDVTVATTQTAISDMFFTADEWDALIASLSEA